MRYRENQTVGEGDVKCLVSKYFLITSSGNVFFPADRENQSMLIT